MTQAQVTVKVYNAITGTAVTDLLNSAKFRNNTPDYVDSGTFTAFEVPPGSISPNFDYGGQVLAYLIPPTTDSYTFYLAADDGAAVWLSTDESPANKVQIATEPVWAGSRAYFATGSNGGANRGTPASNISAPISLVGGQKYYIEAIWKEGGGGDHIALTWSAANPDPNNPGTAVPANGTIANGADPIPGEYLQPYTNIYVTIQSNQSVTLGQPAIFTINQIRTPDGSTANPTAYQWNRNGTPITDGSGTFASYTNQGATLADNNAQYTLTVTEGGISTTSSAVTLTVTGETVPPTVTGALAKSGTKVIVNFSELVDETTGEVTGNYSFSPSVTVSSAEVANASVVLTTSALTPGQSYTITVTGVKDRANNTIGANNTATVVGPAITVGFVNSEVFTNITGITIPDLTSSSKYPYSADVVSLIPAIDQPSLGDNYGVRLSGYIIPPTNGNYYLFLRSDDAGQLFLSSNDNPANLGATPIAQESVWNGVFMPPLAGNEETSAAIPLVGGQRYYFEALMKEGTGGDHLEVGMMEENDTFVAANIFPLGGQFIAGWAPAANTTTTISQNPTNQSKVAGQTATFSVAATNATGPLTYQWRKNGVAIPGAHSSSYTTPALFGTDSGSTYSVVVYSAGSPSVTSTSANLSVTDDSAAPVIMAVGSLDGEHIGVCFNEVIDTNTLDVANFTVAGAEVLEVRVRTDLTGVGLTVTNLTGTNLTVTVRNVADQFGNAISATGVSKTGKVDSQGFTTQDVGDPSVPNPLFPGFAYTCETNEITVVAGGTDIWDSVDGFHFVHKQISGDFDMQVRGVSITAVNRWSKAGLMVRETLSGDSRNLSLVNDPEGTAPTMDGANGGFGDNNTEINERNVANTATTGLTGNNRFSPVLFPNAWLKITRRGDVFTFYRGTDGTNWTQLNQATRTYPTNVYVGMVVTAHNNGGDPFVNTAVFRDFSLIPVVDDVCNDPMPTLTIVRSGSNIVVSWPVLSAACNVDLHGSSTVTGPYNHLNITPVVSGGMNTVTLPATGNQFFILKQD